MTVALSEQRKIEDALVGLLAANSEVVDLLARVKAGYDVADSRRPFQVVVCCEEPENADMASTGGGSFYHAVVRLDSGFAPQSTGGSIESLNKLHGACERFWRSLTKATLNTALSGVTVHGIVSAAPTTEQVKDGAYLVRSSARTLHYEVTA